MAQVQTLLQIQNQMAALLDVAVADFTVNSADTALFALNSVRRAAELRYDFEFTRVLAQVTIPAGTAGVSLDTAVLHSDEVTAVNVKTVVDVGVFDDDGNFLPSLWTTVDEGLVRQRMDNATRKTLLVPTDADLSSTPRGQARFEFRGRMLYHWPVDADNDFTVGIEAYTIQDDWTATLTMSGVSSPSAMNGTWTPGTVGTQTVYFKYDSATACYVLWQTAGVWYITNAAEIFDTAAASRFTLTGSSPAGTYGGAVTFTGTPVVTYTNSIVDKWTTYGSDYLLYAAICQLNYRFKHFVMRQEGNVGPPMREAQEALEAFREWDVAQYEQNRQHNR